jgi:hypothetical protein
MLEAYMRMWMTGPKTICNKHLIAEHYEIHLHRHNFVKGHSIEGRRGQIDPAAMSVRHDELVEEMLRRGYKHNSPYVQPDLSAYDLTGHGVDAVASLADLLNRCEECKARYKSVNDQRSD